MSNNHRERLVSDVLRREAARQLHERQSAQAAKLSEAELHALVNDLQVRNFELEMQVEELQRAPAAADNAKGTQVERLLRESEERSHLLMDSIPAYISYVDTDERYRWVNRSYELFFGRPRSEIIGCKLAELQEEIHYRNMRPYVRQALAGHKAHYENTISNPQGESRIFDTNYIPHAANDGTILGFFVLVYDITERKLFERSLQLTQFSIDRAVDSVFWIGPDAEILYVNDAACRALGYAREEILGKTVPDIDPNFPAKNWPAHWEEIRQRKSFTFESDHYTKTGELIHTEVTVNHLVFEGREYNCAMMRNITERKEAEAQLSQLAAIVTSSEDAIMSKSLEGVITSWNESAERLFGYSAAEMIGAPITRIFPPDRIDEEADILSQIQAGKRVEHLETIRVKRDGTPVQVSVTISPIKNAAGQITGASKSVRDITNRRRAEDALRESEQRFQAFMNQSPVVAWLKDENFKFRYVNHALEKLFNLPADQILGRTDYELYDKQEAEITRANDERVLASDTILQDIEQVKGADGRPRQWLVQKFPLHRTGQPTWTGGTAVDVTDRREAEVALQESNERFRLLFESANDAIFWADADSGLLIECNRAAETLLGRERDEIIGQSYTFLHPAEDAPQIKEIFEAHAKANSQASIEVDIARKDGRRVAVSISPAVTTISGKHILQGIFRNITDRKEAEQALRDSEQRYRTLIDTCADSVYLLDTAGNIRAANPAALRMHGYTLDELLKMNIRDLNDPANTARVQERLDRIQSGGALQFETVHQRKDGTSFPTEVRATPVTIGNETLILAFDRDISERKGREEQTSLLREELAYTSRLVTLREMASGLAHELNQPLAAMCLYVGSAVELAAQYKSTELNECMRRISEQLQHTGEIIRSMRAFAGRGSARREFVNINLLIEDVLTLLAGELKRSDTAITLQLHTPMFPVFAQGVQIKQVLVNLIRNALEEMIACEGCERKLVIRTEFQQKEVRVSVSDTGPGLDPAIANRLFLPFQTTKPDGLGMGLAICRTLIEALGGRIGFESSPENGTTFYFVLPRSTETL